MFHFHATGVCVSKRFAASRGIARLARCTALATTLLSVSFAALAQDVVTEHYDNARTGLNPNESILNTSNVNATSFGKLFSQSVDGQIYAQPLYMAGLAIPGKGTHNVVFVATENDSVYAFDADNNGGANALPLWQISFLTSSHGAASGATTIPNGDVSSTDIRDFHRLNASDTSGIPK